MMKSIRTLVRQDREKYVIPRRVQDVIPIQKIWEDGIFLTGGRYAKSFRFTDINYQVASEPDKEKMFRGYSAIINSLDCGATTKITIFNHRMSQINFEKSILMPMQWDGLDDYREEYNQMLLDKATNGKRTHVFIDEFHVVFENEFSAAFFNSAWRQFRKRNAFPTAITQNVEYLLDSVQASTMLSNSEFIVMLNQAASDREKLGRLLNISNEQMNYITNVEAGSGLIKYGSALVPFINRFPKDTKLYQLMTTRPGEGRFAGQS